MRRTLYGVLISVAAVGLFASAGVAQSGGLGTAGMEPVPGQAAQPERKFVFDFNALVVKPGGGMLNCPVAMEAKRLGAGDLLNVRNSPTRWLGQRIRLRLRNAEVDSRIVRAQVAVRGTDGKPRMSTLAESAKAGGEVTKTLNLSLTDGGASWAAADFLLRGLTSVSRVSLEILTYENGTTWRRSGESSCSLEPDPLMLISGR